MSSAPLRLRFGVGARTILERTRDLLHLRPVAGGALHPSVAQVRRCGVVAVPGVFDRQWCEAAVAELAPMLGDDGGMEIEVDDVGSDHRLWGAQKRARSAAAFGADSSLGVAADSYLRCRSDAMTTLVGHLVPAAGNKGSGGGWHRDSAFQPQFKAIVYLTDVGPDNGPFQYVSGSHRLSSVMSSLAISGRRGITRYETHDFHAEGQVETMVGQAGTVVLADTRGLHRGAPIVSGSRWAMTNYYFPRHRRPEFETYFRDVPGALDEGP